jgi:hypothetical protein
MGTRSLTFVYDESDRPVLNLYRQFDGYPTGHGAELAEFLSSGKMVNGIQIGQKETVFNGMGCLAAQMVASFKQSPGGFYIYSVESKDCGQDYEYHVYNRGSSFLVKIYDCGCNLFGESSGKREPLFSGNLEAFANYCSNERYGEVQVDKPVFQNDASGQDWLKSVLRDGEVTVTFTKVDGTERVMKCTLKEGLIIPTESEVVQGKVKRTKVPSPDVLPVFDTEAKQWKSFRWDSIKQVDFSV